MGSQCAYGSRARRVHVSRAPGGGMRLRGAAKCACRVDPSSLESLDVGWRCREHLVYCRRGAVDGTMI
eukprot:scaffold67572_cov69-Phaeocystis_antarctica.AAC.1